MQSNTIASVEWLNIVLRHGERIVAMYHAQNKQKANEIASALNAGVPIAQCDLGWRKKKKKSGRSRSAAGTD